MTCLFVHSAVHAWMECLLCPKNHTGHQGVKEVPEFPLCTERQTVPVMATDLEATEREGSFLRPEQKDRGQLDQAPVSMVWF